jgi:dihydroxy-acid dehydratase
LHENGALVVIRGNLAPDAAILKRSAASPHLLNVVGRAVVFNSLQDLAARIDDPELDVKPNDVLVLQNAGPMGAPGMPEAGYLPIPKKLSGVIDMVRISDARMSGTAFGTIVLHVSPEAAVGGPFGIVRNGDLIELSVDKQELNLLLDEREIQARKSHHKSNPNGAKRGYEWLYHQFVQQADIGADFEFLRHESLRSQLPSKSRE